MPTPVRIKDGHHSFTATGVADLSTEVRRQATHMMIRANQAFRFTVDGTDPSATIGIYVASNTTVNIPCKGGTLKVIRVGSSSTRYQVQAFENSLTGGDVFEQNIFYPLASSTTEDFIVETFNEILPDDTVVSSTVPANATSAVIEAGETVRYTTDGSDPDQTTGTQLVADTPTTITVSPGGTLKFYETAASTDNDVTVIYYAADGLSIDVPGNAVWAWLSSASQSIKYSTNGVAPNATTRGITVTTTGNSKVPVPSGTNKLMLRPSSNGALATILFFGE